ncbi:MAG: hypothetical protein KF828_00990 [Anaerolineales bacterium]|jgi:hypothetical protein|nr:hypothetical protein [Anaerolineales bacterium]
MNEIRGVIRPYHRICRQFVDGRYTEGGRWQYITHPKYADSPHQFVNAFNLLQKDLLELFDYIEPADRNLMCYSYRIQELLLRTCIEIESNFKAIFSENLYQNKRNMNMTHDYRKIDISHRLSSYQVKLPYWQGVKQIRTPFSYWATAQPLKWYQDYNATKHNRHKSFERASFSSLIEAMCGLVVVLSAQFHTEDFSPREPYLALEGYGDGLDSAIGGYFRVKFPEDWPEDERYAFDWQELKNLSDPFDRFDYRLLN